MKRNFVGEFCAICDRMADLYEKKNKDYGGAFSEEVEESGWGYATGLLGNKVRRIKHLLLKNTRPEVDESIEDTLIDLANYAVMTLMEVRAKEQPRKPSHTDEDDDAIEMED